MTIIEYAEKIGLLKYLNNQSIDILERAQKAIENKEEYHVIVGARSARLLLQTIILKYEGYLEGCADGREDAIDEIIKIVKDHNNTRTVSTKKEFNEKHQYYRAISQSKMVRLLEKLKEQNK